MSHSYDIFSEVGLVVMRFTGVLTIGQLNKLKSDAIKERAFQSDFNILIDLREADIQISPTELVVHEKWISKHPLYSKIDKFAILTLFPEQVEVSFNYVKNAGLRIDHYMIFQTVCNSLEWLEIEDTPESVINVLESVQAEK